MVFFSCVLDVILIILSLSLLLELRWRNYQSKLLSPLRSWVLISRIELMTLMSKRVSQRSTESRGFLWVIWFPTPGNVDGVGLD